MEIEDFDSLPPAPDLDYETPGSKSPGLDWERINWLFLRLIRRIIFAVGAGVFFYGFGDAIGHSNVAESMSTGAVLLALCIPLGRLPGEPRF